MTRIKGQLTTANYLPFDEYLRLIQCLRNDNLLQWEAFCKLAFCTAFRVSDVQTTCWKDVLGKKEFVKIEKKTQKARIVTLNEEIQTGIMQVYKLLGSPPVEQSVICNPNTLQPYSREHINRRLKEFRFRYKLKIRNLSTHSFRKTFGRYVYDQWGGSSEALMLLNTILKHTSLETTKRYIGLMQDDVDKVFNSLRFSKPPRQPVIGSPVQARCSGLI